MNVLTLSSSKRIIFKKLKSVNNPKSVHGIYPYRGKISAVDAIQIIEQLPRKGVLLDPFCGSGTIIYEAKRMGFDVIGVDNNPIAIQIARAKLSSIDISESILKVKNIISNIKDSKKKMPEKAKKYFHPKTAREIMNLLGYYEEFNDYEKAVFLGAICLAARGCNHYIWSSTQIGKLAPRKKYIPLYDKFLMKLKKHYYCIDISNAKIILGDTRRLSSFIPNRSVDFVYTSPPYFDALDYTSYYTRIIHYILGTDIGEMKKGLIQNFENYEYDMKQCLSEIMKVAKEDALIIFVVGDKKRGNEIINGGQFFKQIYEREPNFIIQREYSETASKIWDKINKTQRKEQVIVWDKSTW